MKDFSFNLKLIQLLSGGEFHSGEQLGEQFGVSRAAIARHIKSIQDLGIDIYSVKGKGYRLDQPLDLLNQQTLIEQLDTPIEVIPIIDSTNQHMLGQQDLESGSVCVAEYQTQGRGRRGREWVSPFGSNIYYSMYWRLEAGLPAAMGISLVIGLALVDALEQLGIEGLKLKWPNDVYYNNKKLAGILVELSGQAGDAANLVIGVGLNVSMPEHVQGIGQPWTSLKEISGGKTLLRNDIVIALTKALKSSIAVYEQESLKPFLAKWNQYDNFIEQPIKLLMGNREIKGICKGINAQGALLLDTGHEIESFIGGEISVRSAS
ncbi:biotin--[acetyl-CoA-carboxylase] ligase [Vibrio sp. UCD-FRSSP16_10]|uniref:bifunctional biotin--[acetyl-CoA-carboxylase] ligase/biotin operon repressor BirA n=1 Tax=unclassified Vibrio TaxID=2614977 RepID=UPI0007FB8B73|nr:MULTISPECIES: bifunctional biotin--[acetyl-CoA-carboxylase] ligase/biotin operon repressor BirA [unclassified Vibrio]OBT12029.1 biotin--[acetyl-CoA-carboxylase] ligase [Vibrio sp. UCD-FRSSP16_30]OBT18181.1 biotin--[acetyl-CoA-carboxylase] ligase [Vibrio sp. UCD-FRSSP16_10]